MSPPKPANSKFIRPTAPLTSNNVLSTNKPKQNNLLKPCNEIKYSSKLPPIPPSTNKKVHFGENEIRIFEITEPTAICKILSIQNKKLIAENSNLKMENAKLNDKVKQDEEVKQLLKQLSELKVKEAKQKGALNIQRITRDYESLKKAHIEIKSCHQALLEAKQYECEIYLNKYLEQKDKTEGLHVKVDKLMQSNNKLRQAVKKYEEAIRKKLKIDGGGVNKNNKN
ncbi:hypothetical protein ABK040_013688 [Willaertia magna]